MNTPKPEPFPLKAKPTDKLNFSTKLAFGAGDLGTAITANLQTFYFGLFLSSVAGVNAATAALILPIGKIWDAVNDPLVGFLSDRLPSRWGRRYPWMVIGSVPFGLIFVLMWIVPFESDWALFWYYTLVGILFNTAYTTINLPYTALTPELTQDYDERTSLNSFRFAFSIGGSLGSFVLAGFLFQQIADETRAYLVLSIICGIISILSVYWCVFGTADRVLKQKPQGTQASADQTPFLEQLKIAFSNRPFLYVIGIYLWSWLAVQITGSIVPFFVTYWMGMPQAKFTLPLAVQTTALVLLFFWSWLSKRVGKKKVYFLGMGLWIVAQAGLLFLQPNQVILMYGLAVLAGFGVSTAYLIPWSMIPDVVDLDELNTGQRREGIFYSFMIFFQKMGLALGLFLIFKALDWAGFIESVAGAEIPVQPQSALWAIRIAIGPLPTICLIVGLILAYFYPINREVHAEILLKLQERKQTHVS